VTKRVIRNFDDGSQLYFDTGKFDDWCVHICRADGIDISPKDNQYFLALREFTEIRDSESICEDFIAVKEEED
jgi:hypothetical protein